MKLIPQISTEMNLCVMILRTLSRLTYTLLVRVKTQQIVLARSRDGHSEEESRNRRDGFRYKFELLVRNGGKNNFNGSILSLYFFLFLTASVC